MQKPGAAFLVALLALLAAVPAQAAQRPEPRIVNGQAVSAGEYPWTVALVSNGGSSPFCGGTLIANNVVLTAAHCTIGGTPAGIDVVAGDHDLSDIPDANRFNVTKISVHPDADADDEDFVPRYDFSLLTLDGDPGGATTAEPLALATSGAAVTPGTDLGISGWGTTSAESETTVDVMRQAVVQAVDDAECASDFPGLFFSTDQVCAIGEDPDPALVRDTCQGDSGGPLADPGPASTTNSATGWTLVGVTSWGIGCATTEDGEILSGVYGRVSAPLLHAYADQATDNIDDTSEQPYRTGGSVAVSSDPSLSGGGIVCDVGTLTWGGTQPDMFEFLVRRLDGSVRETVSTTGFYTFDEGDAGRQFRCEIRARRGGVGGYGLARSGVVQAAQATPVSPVLVPVPVPGPVETVTVPGPPVLVQPPADDTDPRVRSVRRSCTRRRVCTFTITASDIGTGVKTVAVTLNTVRTRSCRRNGRLTVCASWRATPLRARKVAGTGSTFRVTTARLTRGSHVLHASAVDRAGNIQTTPRAVAFRLR